MRAILDSAFSAAFWFADKALSRNEYLQPQKLQRLLFLAQACHAALYPGRTLMPAVFVAGDAGPLEPNLYLAFSQGRPDIGIDAPLPEEAEIVLEEMWRRFGHLSCDHLGNLTREMPAYAHAHERGNRTEISLESMRQCIVVNGVPGCGEVVRRTRFARTQSGKHVRVRSWMPGEAPAGDDAGDGAGDVAGVTDEPAAPDWLTGNSR
jgi:uncharacterized phage-associated protein